MSDNWPYILKKLKEPNDSVICNNKSSLLVSECGVKYGRIIQ
jgi:hypothetical protein